MKRGWLIAAAAAQVGVLVFMAAQREWVVRTGERILVRTAPVDPNDPMRGEYARFTYEISTVPRELCRDEVAGWFEDVRRYSREFRDRRVYALLERDELGIVSVRALTNREPRGELYIRGRTEWIDERAVRVRYGIEALFMEQGQALAFEMKARDQMIGVPVNAEVALSPGGLAVLHGYHWEPLGLELRLIRREPAAGGAGEAAPGAPRGIIGAIVTLKNHGSDPVAVVDLPGGRSFRLVAAEARGNRDYEPVEVAAVPAPRAADVVLLPPNGTHETRLDLTGPEWLLRRASEGGPAGPSIATLEALDRSWSTWLRVEYVPPAPEACAGLPHAPLIRHARLRSRMFSPAGAMD